MNNFLKTGVYTNGCIIPVNVEDPSFNAIIDEDSEIFRINLYCGSHWIGEINMNNFREVHNDLLTPYVYDNKGVFTKMNVWGHIRMQYLFDKAKIYGANSLTLVKNVHSLAKLDWYFNMLEPKQAN